MKVRLENPQFKWFVYTCNKLYFTQWYLYVQRLKFNIRKIDNAITTLDKNKLENKANHLLQL